MRDLDDVGGAGRGHLPDSAGGSFPWRPFNIGKLGPAVFGLFPYNSFRRTCDSFRIVLQLLVIYFGDS